LLLQPVALESGDVVAILPILHVLLRMGVEGPAALIPRNYFSNEMSTVFEILSLL